MKKTISGGQLRQGVALVLIVLVGLAAGAVIVSHQRLNAPSWVPFLGKDEYTLRTQLTSVQGVLPGQGQAVTIAGVRVGQIGSVDLENGVAVATLRIEKRFGHVYPDATVLLRPKTPLKDMVAELDPGSPNSGPALASGALLRTNHSQPDVNLDEILASLDRDSRDYLRLLVAGGGQALGGRGGRDLAGVFRRFEPLSRHVAKATRLVALRHTELRRVIGNLERLATELGTRDQDLVRFVRGSEGVFKRLANQSGNLQQTVQLLPPALQSGQRALAKVDRLGQTLRSSLTQLQPAVKALAPTLAQLRPFFRTTEPILRNSFRPFSRDAQPAARLLAPASRDLSNAAPNLTTLTDVLNSIVNEVAYKSPGTGADSNSYLFYVPWASHNTNSVMSLQDGIGPLRRGMILVSCSSLGILDTLASPTRNPTLATLIQLLGVPKKEDVCKATGASK